MMMSLQAYSTNCDTSLNLHPKKIVIQGETYYQWTREQAEVIYCKLIDRKRLIEVLEKSQSKIDTLEGVVVNYDSLTQKLDGQIGLLEEALDLRKGELKLAEGRITELKKEVNRQKVRKLMAFGFIALENTIIILIAIL